MSRETAYDHVFHAQNHFRVLLESMSRPGTIGRLTPVECHPPSGLARASTLIALALLNADVSFHLVGMTDHEATYLTANTAARPAPIEKTTFIIAPGLASADLLEGASCGTLAYPDTSATLVVQLAGLSRAPINGGLRLQLQGAGVDGREVVYVQGLNPDLLLALQARNAEFPLGIDTILTSDQDDDAKVLCLPRTTQVSWDAC